jgi:hypothetical protein
MKDDKKDPMNLGSKGYQQTQSNQPNRGNPQKGSDEGKPAWKPGNENKQKPERGDDEHQHENKQPVSNPNKGVNKPGDTATGTTQEGSTGTEKGTTKKKSVSSDSMGGGASSAGGGSGSVD